MVVYAFEPVEVEQQRMVEIEAARSRQRMLASQVTPDLGARLVALNQAWPDIPPGALVAMAMSGIDPMSDVARQVEQRAVEVGAGRGFHSPGEVVSAQQLEREGRPVDEERGLVGRGVDALRSGVRGAFMGMETAFEEVRRPVEAGLVAMQRDDMSFSEAMDLARPSMGRVLASDEFGWEDLGDGWIPSGEVREHQERMKHRLTLDGEWMSPGRALAINVTEPGTKSFNFTSGLIDAAFRIFGDPATYATAGIGKVRMANRAFATDSALIRGLRRTTDEQYARNWWLGSAPGQRLRQSLVDETDPYEVWRRLGGHKEKVDRDTARLIADARTFDQLDSVVLPRLGPQGLAEKPVGGALSRGAAMMFGDDLGAVHGLGIHVRRFAERNVRMAQWMPRQSGISISDPNETVLNLHRFMVAIKASDDQAKPLMERAFRMGTGGDRATGDNWLEFTKDLGELAVERAMRDSVGARSVATGTRGAKRAERIRNRIGRAVEREMSDHSLYFTREAGRPRSNAKAIINGREVDLERQVHLATEMLNRNLPLPDMQEVRQHIGGYAKAMRALDDLPRGTFEGINNVAVGLVTAAWKPMVLLRGAYITRVTALEEQLRMGASGLDSLYRHPVSYLAWMTGRRGGVGVSGDPVKEMIEFQAIAQRKGGGWIRNEKPGSIATERFKTYRRFDSQGNTINDSEFARAMADDFSQLVNDGISSVVARLGREEAVDYLMSARGKHLVRDISSVNHFSDVATSRRALEDYVDTVWWRIEEKTRGNQDLIEAIATGRLDGKVVRWDRLKTNEPPPSMADSMMSRLDELGVTEVKGREFITTTKRGSSSENLLGRYNQVVDYLADQIMSKPTNHMSRFPSWQQHYVRNIEQQLGFMDAATQQNVIRWAAKEANLTRSQVRRMERTARAGQGTTITDVETADLIGRAAATRDTRKLLYELTELGQFSDAARAAIPFAEAYKEILVAWSRIIRDQPQVVRRGQQVIEGARGSGFFHTDPSSGEELFTYPGGHLVSRALLSGAADSSLVQGAMGLPGVGSAVTAGLGVAGAFMDEQPAEFDLEGRVSGLNLVGSVMPGLGPAVTMPAALIVPDRPEFDWVRENVLFPFGEPEVDEGIIESMFPAWMKKLRTGWLGDPETDRIYANSVFDVAKALMATGEYSTDSHEEIERLMAVAKQRAKSLWLVRGAAQFVVPTGPQARFRVQDLNEQWWPYQVIATEFHRMQQEHGEDQAVADFLATFGTDLISLVQSKSRQIVPRPTTEVGDDWIRANEDLATSYPLTVGLLAPDDPTGEFHYPAYQRHFDEGTREQLRPEQMLWLSNNILGRFAYSHATDELERRGVSEADARPARLELRSQLMDRYPGFNSHIGVTQRPRVDEQIRELEAIVSDDRVQGMEATDAIREYLEVRRAAQLWVENSASRSTGFTRSAETVPIRTWLRQQADDISRRNPAFIPVWDRVFSRELADDDVVEPGQMDAPSMGGADA